MDRRSFIWNMAGSTVYAVISMLLGTAVMRILGASDGGIFLFAFSTVGQHIYILSYFGMRPVQVTDTGRNYSFGDYRRFRLMTCTAALIAALLFALLYSGFSKKAAVIIIVALFRILDGFADCCESEYQRDGKLYLTGMSLTARSAAVMAVFIAAMALTKDLTLSCLALLLAQAAAVLVCCVLPLRNFPGADMTVQQGSAKRLFDAGKWLFLSAFLDMFVFSASKYAVDMVSSSEMSGYYSLIFIPASVVNLMAGFVIRPVLTGLSDDYSGGRLADFKSRIFRISGLIGALTLLGMTAAYFLGIPVLTLLAGKDAGAALGQYRGALVILILGGGFYALANLLYYALVILRCQKTMFAVYVLITAAAFASGVPAAKNGGLKGAAISFLCCMILLTAGFTAAAAGKLKKNGADKNENGKNS